MKYSTNIAILKPVTKNRGEDGAFITFFSCFNAKITTTKDIVISNKSIITLLNLVGFGSLPIVCSLFRMQDDFYNLPT